MKIHTFCGGFDKNFSYLIVNAKKALIIDPLDDLAILDFCAKNAIVITHILITHDHFDHHQGVGRIRKTFGAQVIAHKKALLSKDIPVDADTELPCAGLNVEILCTPGHSPSAICFKIETHLFTGDTLFVGTVGGTGPFFPGSSGDQLQQSLQKLFALPKTTRIYPGHDYGPTPTSTIGKELTTNPFAKVGRFSVTSFIKKKIARSRKH